MQQLQALPAADPFAAQAALALTNPGNPAVRHEYDAAALGVCGMLTLPAATTVEGERRSFGDYLAEWLKLSAAGAKSLIEQVKVGATRMYSREEIYDFTEQEVCSFLARAVHLISSGVEDQFLSDRLEPWIGLARPISHNIDTRVYYWPEVEI